MAAKVVVSVRMDGEVRDQFQEWAKEDRRSLGNYLESLFMMECARRKNGDETLGSLGLKIDHLIALHNQSKVKPTKEVKERGSREILEQVLALELPSSLTSEAWKKWVLHLRMKKNNKLDVATAQAILERWTMAQDNGYDLEELVEIAIQRNTADAVYDSHLDQPKREGKRGSVDHASLFSSCVNG